MIRALFSTWDKHEHLFRASLDARATSATVRELWDSDRESFVPVVAAMIEAERAAGAAPAGVDATALAGVLLELNDRMLERLALGGPLDREQLVEAVVAVWLHTIYGRGPSGVKHDQVTFTSGGVELRRLALHRRRRRVRRTRRPAGRGDGARPRRHQGLRARAVRHRPGRGRARRARLRLPRLRRQRRYAAPARQHGRPGRGLPRRDGRGRPAARRGRGPAGARGASRWPAATCSPPRPAATTSPRSSR